MMALVNLVRQRSASLLWLPFAAAAAGLFTFYLAIPDVRAATGAFPTRTAYMDLRARETGSELKIHYRPVPLSRIASPLVHAVLTGEDAGFYVHRGIDWYELREALAKAWRKRSAPRGASTLTQQLARNLYLSPSRSLARKAQELVIARRLEQALPKRRILELYLNVIEWGPGVFGAEAAARTYFGKPASELTDREAVQLAATIPQPLVANPLTNPGRLGWRARLIWNRMILRGESTRDTVSGAGAAEGHVVSASPADTGAALAAPVSEPPDTVVIETPPADTADAPPRPATVPF